MKKEHMAFLFVGFAFGALVGYGLFDALERTPDLTGQVASNVAAPAPAGPLAPTQVGSAQGQGAPMMAEINALKQRLQEHPEDLATLVRLANLYHDVRMWEQALQFYERALVLRPEDPDLLTDAGVCYRGVRRYDKALELFDKAHELDPTHYQSLFNTVIVAGFDLARFDVARAAMDRLDELEPPPPRLSELKQALAGAIGAGPAAGS